MSIMFRSDSPQVMLVVLQLATSWLHMYLSKLLLSPACVKSFFFQGSSFSLFAPKDLIGHVNLAAITGTIVLVPYLYAKSLQLIWSSGRVYFIYGCLILKWVAETEQHDRVPG